MALFTVGSFRMRTTDFWPRRGSCVTSLTVFARRQLVRDHRRRSGEEAFRRCNDLCEPHELIGYKLAFFTLEQVTLAAVLEVSRDGVWIGGSVAVMRYRFSARRVTDAAICPERLVWNNGWSSIERSSRRSSCRRREFGRNRDLGLTAATG